MLTTRTPEAHASRARRCSANTKRTGCTIRRTRRGTIIFPGVDGGGEWGGPAFDPETGLLYVNANEMPWLMKLVPRNDRSLYGANCASCHGDDLKGSPAAPSLVDVGTRMTRERAIATIIRAGHGPHAGLRRRRSTTRPSTIS